MKIKSNMEVTVCNILSKNLKPSLIKIFKERDPNFEWTKRGFIRLKPIMGGRKRNKVIKPGLMRFRIMEKLGGEDPHDIGLRVEDMSFFNFKLIHKDNNIYFNKVKGIKNLHWSDELQISIIIDEKHQDVIIVVYGEVYYDDGSRRYENKL